MSEEVDKVLERQAFTKIIKAGKDMGTKKKLNGTPNMREPRDAAWKRWKDR